MKVTDNAGRECDLSKEVEEILFEEDVKLVRYLLRAGLQDEEIYQTLEGIFQSRSERGIPNVLTKALFLLYKMEALRSIEIIQNRIAAVENLEHALFEANNQRTARAIQKAIDGMQKGLLFF